MVTGESTANLFLPNGGILELKGGEGTKLSNLDTVCTLSAGEKGELYASRISGRNAPGDFDPSSMTLGNKTVSVGVRVYEQVQGAAAQVAVPLSELDLERIPRIRSPATTRTAPASWTSFCWTPSPATPTPTAF